jgi:pimeloyl-ACP methyl ester carboxylesterase
MAYVVSRGQRIHYDLRGTGPLVILQHGFLSSGESWEKRGFVSPLSDKYRVACVDSLGHGLSDKPSDVSLYRSEQRSRDLVAVMDDLDCERAHLVGYSMGDGCRLLSHDFILSGLRPCRSVVGTSWAARRVRYQTASNGPLTYDWLIGAARDMAPDLVAWITPAIEPGLNACCDALTENVNDAGASVAAPKGAVQLWCGRGDPCHEPMKLYAGTNGLRFESLPGGHVEAITLHRPEAAKRVRAFLDTV